MWAQSVNICQLADDVDRLMALQDARGARMPTTHPPPHHPVLAAVGLASHPSRNPLNVGKWLRGCEILF